MQLATLFGDGMVLQRETRAPMWGRAAPGSEVRVRAEWSAAEVVARADARGAWRVELATPSAGGPYTIRVAGTDELTLRDVWIGEVWLCSGQSNMEWKLRPGELGGVLDSEREIAEARHPRIRVFEVANRAALHPASDVRGQWVTCSPQTAGEFTAVGYFFARELERELDVPIGIVDATWSGTRIEAWLEGSTASALDATRAEWQRFANAREALDAGPQQAHELDPQTISALFNGMVAPLVPYALRGFLWYQGESNRSNASDYVELQSGLVRSWRELWGSDAKPFYFVQIAPFAYEDDGGETGALRDAQRRCLALENTGMVATMDIGDPLDIHPRNKREVGRRLSLWALARTYGRTAIVHSGPLFKAVRFEGQRAHVTFDELGGGLISGGDHLTGFELAGEDRRFVRATATIEGDEVVVVAKGVLAPVAVRYGCRADAQPILFNKAWLPAAAFRSDSWPIR